VACALKSYPIGTPIPYRLRVTTRTRLVERSHVPDDGNKSLFPALPTDPARLELWLFNYLHVKAQGRNSDFVRRTIGGLGGLGAAASRTASDAVRVAVDEPKWTPAEGEGDTCSGKGTWTRSVTFSSSLRFPCPPTITTSVLSCDVRSTRLHVATR
jgi:hypothetical protein